jgi:hypothetical protein
VSFATSLNRSFFASKSKIPPQLGRAAFDVLQPLRDEVDVLGIHGASSKNDDYSVQPRMTLVLERCITSKTASR